MKKGKKRHELACVRCLPQPSVLHTSHSVLSIRCYYSAACDPPTSSFQYAPANIQLPGSVSLGLRAFSEGSSPALWEINPLWGRAFRQQTGRDQCLNTPAPSPHGENNFQGMCFTLFQECLCWDQAAAAHSGNWLANEPLTGFLPFPTPLPTPLPVLPPPFKYTICTHVLVSGSASGQTQTKTASYFL